ncbi:MAG: hypothetical protein WC967_13625 [Balneolaceae bacterium]
MSVILRSKFPKEKTVLLLNDQPFKNEVQDGEKFSSAANTGLLTALRTGKCNNYSGITPEGYKGIISTDIYQTYLDYEPFSDGNFDYTREIKKRKDLRLVQYGDGEGESCLVDKDYEFVIGEDILPHEYHKLEHQKDVYISGRLHKELQGLVEEIRTVKPKLIIVTGKWSLFFLTGCTSLTANQGNYKDKKPLGGLNKYRSSLMAVHSCFGIKEPHVLLPIWHTVNAMGMPDKVSVMNLDLQKAGWIYHIIKEHGVEYYAQSLENFTISIEKEVILGYLDKLHKRLDEGKRRVSVDIETKFSAMIDCIGITDIVNEGICIPFAGEKQPNIFSLEDEVEITVKMFEILQHPNCEIVAQNWFYDSSFISDQYCVNLYSTHDSMLLHHLLYNYLPKDLSFLASIYAERYTQWKQMQVH